MGEASRTVHIILALIDLATTCTTRRQIFPQPAVAKVAEMDKPTHAKSPKSAATKAGHLRLDLENSPPGGHSQMLVMRKTKTTQKRGNLVCIPIYNI
jgi:hypothetical protein